MSEPDAPVLPDDVRRLLAEAEVSSDGVPRRPLLFVDLCSEASDPPAVESAVRRAEIVAVGVARAAVPPPNEGIEDALACTITPLAPTRITQVRVADVDAAVAHLRAAVATSPRAALTMRRLLEVTDTLPVHEGLAAESTAYSMLLAGAEFAAWLAARRRRPAPEARDDAVVSWREGEDLRVRLNVPERRNAYSRQVRDALVEAFELALTDPDVTRIVWDGAGPAFCSGGDLDEFGSTTDVSSAHVVRMQRSAARCAHDLAARLEVRLHGACIGAGIEIPSFAGRLLAAEDTVIALPELAMGLVPGAGGTVGIPRRIGRWRCAWMHLTGARIDVGTAIEWGLVDGRR